MKKYFPVRVLISAFVLPLIIFVPKAFSGVVLYDSFKREYRVQNVDIKAQDTDNRRLFKAVEYSIKASESTLDGKKVYVVARDEKNADGDKQEWKFYVDPDEIRLLVTEREFVSRNGKSIETTRRDYSAHYHRFPENSFPMHMFPYAAQIMDLNPGAVTEFNIIFSPEFSPWSLYLMVDGEESITVPAGTFDCIRIKVKYNKDQLPGFFKMLPSFLIDTFFPDIFMWVGKDPPHTMIKLQGKLDGMSSPEKVHELVRVSPN